MQEIIEQIKKIPGVKEIYPAGKQSVVIVFNPSEPIVIDGEGINKLEDDYRKN